MTDRALHGEVKAFFTRAIKKAMESYHDFMDQNISTKPKDFGDHHSAGKLAIAHVELLLKLAEKMGFDAMKKEDPAFHALLLEAQGDVDAFHENESPDTNDLA